jgi:hypothetical protein
MASILDPMRRVTHTKWIKPVPGAWVLQLACGHVVRRMAPPSRAGWRPSSARCSECGAARAGAPDTKGKEGG